MPARDIIVLAASAGGVEAYVQLVETLPPDLPAAFFVVMHIPPNETRALPSILSRAGPLPVKHAEDGEKIEMGRIYVAPPDFHMLVKPGYISLLHGPRENRARPAADPLFRSAAAAYGERVVGVILSGLLDDGTEGLKVIKARGGVAIVQDPEEAFYQGMPRNAIENVEVDHVLPVAAMGPLLVLLAQGDTGEPRREAGNGEESAVEAVEKGSNPDILEQAMMGVEYPGANRSGNPSSLVCPECGGVLWEAVEGENRLLYRCRVGHGYSLKSLQSEMSENVEAALWNAVRVLEEKQELLNKLADRMKALGNMNSHARFIQRARKVREHAGVIRQVLQNEKVKD